MSLSQWVLIALLGFVTWLGYLGWEVSQHAQAEITAARSTAERELSKTGESVTRSVADLEIAMEQFSKGMVRWSEGQTKATKYAIALDTGQAIIVAGVILIFILLPAVGVRVFTRRQYERRSDSREV